MGNKKKVVIILAIAGAFMIAIVIAVGLLQGTSSRMPAGTGSRTSALPQKSVSSMVGLDQGEVMKSAPSLSESVAESSADEEETSDKKIIKSGYLTCKVASADEASEEMAKIAKANGGEVFSTDFSQDENNVKSGTVTVKVPVASFEKTFEELKKVASLIISESTSGLDVTEQYTDLQSRLKNKQAEEQAFASILQRSGEIDDVLKVTKELARVRGEIEVLQGKIRLLESQTDMSTIAVNLTEDKKITVTDKWRPLQLAKDSINSLFKDAQKFVNFVIILVIQVIPVLVLYLLLFFVIYLIIRKIYRKIKAKKEISQQ